ncbi:hypothetical protein L596_001241 [Steinernema carpocapsae]|uniref:SRR1-like domain-containing protein n=1 Tax=Steinernema carpocapsae TaxID=34508 RepID=A0A4U8ULQ6_STECR|nr:hypothetical protein L596_001241 [Steinernema carpocapsae]
MDADAASLHLAHMRALLSAAEDELLDDVKNIYAKYLHSYQMVPYKNGVPDKESILQVASEQLNGRRVRHLKGVWTSLLDTKDRLWNLAMLLLLKIHLQPLECSYEDPNLSVAEKAYLESESVATPPPQDFSKAKIPPFEDGNFVDIFFMVDCNWFMMNNLLLANWNTPELRQMLLVNHSVITPDYHHIWEAHHGLLALQKVKHNVAEGKAKSKRWYYYRYSQHILPCSVCAVEILEELPEIGDESPDLKWCFQPSYLKAQDDPKSLVDMGTFDHVTWNLNLIKDHYRQIGFTQEYLSDLETLLEGRSIRRIKILGLGNMATLYILKQLAFVLNIKEHFGVEEVSSQEPVATDFENRYLNSIGVATPPHDKGDQPEEGLGENEVTLFFWHMLFSGLRENVIRANQDRLRNVIVIHDVCIGKGSRWYPLLSEGGKKCMDEKAAKWQKHERMLQRTSPEQTLNKTLSALFKFSENAKSIPLRYEVIKTTPSDEPFLWCPFFGMEMLSYPRANLFRD